ncbi:MAG: C10 family peptidase [Muribaculaceae bacterium]|nr:C10 family peptidase [Muribaculaceae bacterium]
MIRIRSSVFIACLFWAGALWAGNISERQAGEIAAKFMAGHSMPATSLTPPSKYMTHGASEKQTAYYVFNASVPGRGFVIVAGDDRLPAVLGYSDTGTFDPQDVPPAMQEWLEGYTAQVEAIQAGAAPQVRTTPREAIAPMLPVRWGQGMPYNVLLPHISGSSNAHAYVGCVAVAMAQVMAYWQYPQRPTTTIPGYTSSSGKTYAVTMPSLAPADFDWESMQDTYYTTDSASSASAAVSRLMLYSTTAVSSNFGPSSTGSFTRYIPERLMTYFGYKNSAQYIYREDYSTEGWENVIYAELAAGRPVAYGGNKLSAGHAFVCDGYDGEGRFHINWGWAGKSNGYFLLNLLNPSDEGIGSAAGAYGYVYGQGAAIGLEPDDGSDGEAAFTFEDLTLSSYNGTRSAASSNFSVSVSGKFVNYTHVTSMFSQGWGLFKDGEMVENLFYRNATSAIGYGGYITVSSRTLSFGAGLTSGAYRILPIYCIYGTDKWQPCIGSDVNYIEVTFNGAYSCTIKGYGTAGSTTRYTVNGCATEGTLNHGKPVTVNLNLTNTGTSTNDMVYMFVDGEFTAMGLAGIGAGETGTLVYRFTPTTAGTKKLTFSLNESGVPTLYTTTVTIATMPSASLDVNYRILNITDEENRIITADRYSIIADVTNTGTTTYDEEFSVRLYRINNPETNVGTELLNQTQPLRLAPGQSTSLQFDFDHDLIDGWRYFCYLYYYSAGEPVGTGTKWYQLNLDGEPVTPVTRYNVTVEGLPLQGGKVTATASMVSGKVKPGEMVTVSARPNVGWQCDGITVTDAGGADIAIDGNGSYTLVMPEADINIVAHFSRSTGSVFELVTSRDSIVEGGTYVIASQYYDKAMKFHEHGEATFGSTSITEWLDEGKTRVRVNDETCFIQMTAVNPDTIRHGASSGARTNAFLSYGNGYLTTNGGNLVVSEGLTAQCRAGMFVSSNEYNYLVRFFNEASGAASDYMTVRYDYQADAFRIINYSSDNQQRVWLYKLVDETPVEPEVLRGDVDNDGRVNIDDVTALIDYLLGSSGGINLQAADVDADGKVNIDDVTTLIDMLLSGQY